MDLGEVRLRQRVPIWLLAQIGFWAGGWVGPHQARLMMRNHRFFIPLGTQAFVEFVHDRKKKGYSHSEIANELGISTTDLRAIWSQIHNSNYKES